MDYNAPVYPAPQEPPQKRFFRRFSLVVIEALIVFLVIVFFLGIANYFNVVSLSRAFPSQFGWLPRKPLPQVQITQNTQQGNTTSNSQSSDPGILRYSARSVRSAIIYYTLSDILVTKIREKGRFITVISSVSSDLKLPELTVPDEVQVTLDGDNGTSLATKLDIKEQDILTLYLTYNLKSSKWSVKHVAIQKRQ